MARTYEELLKDTDFMEKVFAEIGKLEGIISKSEGLSIAEMNLSVADKALVDAVDLTVRNMFKMAGCEENLSICSLQNLIDLYGEVYDNVKYLDDDQIDQVAAGLNAFKDPEYRKALKNELYDMADLL